MRQKITLLAVVLSVSGCAGLLDPYQREGTWSIAGTNDANLRAMVDNPLDLQRGTGTTNTLGTSAVGAVVRLRTDRVRELPVSAVATVGPVGGASGAAGGEAQ